MATREQWGQWTRERGTRESGGSVQRWITTPPIYGNHPGAAVLALKAEVERLINELGQYIDRDGKVLMEALSPMRGDLVVVGREEIRRTGGNPSLDLNRTDATGTQVWRMVLGSDGSLNFRDFTNTTNVVILATGASANSILVDSTGVAIGSTVADAALDVTGTIKIAEQAAADADTAGKGQLWVKNTTPCELWFTDDAGTDTQIV